MANYKHGEAFCLMWYGCPCGHRERIWNSRDGVTPFTMDCPSCGEGTLSHEMGRNAPRDVRAPDHQPYRGQGFWRDGTPDDAASFMAMRLEMCAGTTYEVSEERRADLIEGARDGKFGDFQKGWPMFERRPRYG